jgi:hypothetical protein
MKQLSNGAQFSLLIRSSSPARKFSSLLYCLRGYDGRLIPGVDFLYTSTRVLGCPMGNSRHYIYGGSPSLCHFGYQLFLTSMTPIGQTVRGYLFLSISTSLHPYISK